MAESHGGRFVGRNCGNKGRRTREIGSGRRIRPRGTSRYLTISHYVGPDNYGVQERQTLHPLTIHALLAPRKLQLPPRNTSTDQLTSRHAPPLHTWALGVEILGRNCFTYLDAERRKTGTLATTLVRPWHPLRPPRRKSTTRELKYLGADVHRRIQHNPKNNGILRRRQLGTPTQTRLETKEPTEAKTTNKLYYLSLGHVILSLVGTDTCVNSVELAAPKFSEWKSTLIGPHTVPLEGHEV